MKRLLIQSYLPLLTKFYSVLQYLALIRTFSPVKIFCFVNLNELQFIYLFTIYLFTINWIRSMWCCSCMVLMFTVLHLHKPIHISHRGKSASCVTGLRCIFCRDSCRLVVGLGIFRHHCHQKKWPIGQGAGFAIQGSRVQNH